MIEPRARVVSFEDADFGDMRIQVIKASTAFPELLSNGTELTTVSDVLAALREPSEAMLTNAREVTGVSSNTAHHIFLTMLDQFEKEQGSAT